MFVNYESGAFKEVEIHDKYVVKKAKIRDEYDEYLDDDDVCIEDCFNEMSREFKLVQKTKHLGIFPPILDGDEESYKMAKAEVFWGGEERTAKEQIIYNKLVSDLQRFLRYYENKYSERNNIKHFHDLIEIAAAQISLNKMVYRTALQNIKKIILVDRFRNVSQDLRYDNIGIYKNKPVLVDGGQSSEEPYKTKPSKKFYKTFQSFINEELKNRYYELLRYKNDKQAISYHSSVTSQIYNTGIIVKIKQDFRDCIYITFDNGYSTTINEKSILVKVDNYKPKIQKSVQSKTARRRYSSRQRIR